MLSHSLSIILTNQWFSPKKAGNKSEEALCTCRCLQAHLRGGAGLWPTWCPAAWSCSSQGAAPEPQSICRPCSRACRPTACPPLQQSLRPHSVPAPAQPPRSMSASAGKPAFLASASLSRQCLWAGGASKASLPGLQAPTRCPGRWCWKPRDQRAARVGRERDGRLCFHWLLVSYLFLNKDLVFMFYLKGEESDFPSTHSFPKCLLTTRSLRLARPCVAGRTSSTAWPCCAPGWVLAGGQVGTGGKMNSGPCTAHPSGFLILLTGDLAGEIYK